jgi:GxxExxY protein
VEPGVQLNQLTHGVIGAAIEVHRVLGPGFLESVLRVELTLRGMRFARQVPIGVQYKGHAVGAARVDLVVEDHILIELKALEVLAPVHFAQVLSYLKATGLQLGLLITFNVPVLQHGIRRIILNP